MGYGEWTENNRGSYNKWDAIARSSVQVHMTKTSLISQLEFHLTTENMKSRVVTQVFAGGWTAVYAYLDNVGAWNLRTENLDRWYLGQETYMRIVNPQDPNNKTELPVPDNVLYCGALKRLQK